MPDELALLRLPDESVAPAYRESLARHSHFTVEDFGAGVVGVAPAEGARATASYFEAIKLCDAATDLSASSTWRPLTADPPRMRSDLDPVRYREEMLRRGQEIIEAHPSTESELVAFALAAFGANQTGDTPNLLQTNLPALFERFPDGSLWYVTVSDVLLARLAFGRAQLAFELTPDMPVGEDMDELKATSDLTLTKGIDMSAALNLALVALSPAVLGFPIPAMPHVLIFCFGVDIDLRRPYPTSLSSLYRPSVLNDAEGFERTEFLSRAEPGDGPTLLEWWVGQLNHLYSYIADPTRFTDASGYHDAPAQTAWFVTFERLLADAISLLAEPQASDLDRVQIAFDLLDKAESLLGYGRSESGKGFKALLRRGQCVERVREAFGSLPGGLGGRLAEELEGLFDDLYADIRENTVGFRRTERGAWIARGCPDQLVELDDEALVASLCRAVRNSSHGVLEILRERDDRFLLAANTGGIPAELPALAPLIALGLLADVDGLVDGSWRRELVGSG